MTTAPLPPRKSLNKALLKVKPRRADIERFKSNLIALLDGLREVESEEFHKNLVAAFLRDTWYKDRHSINTKGRNDLVIHNGPKADSSVGVIIEAKKPTNRSEMVTLEQLNRKAFHELVLYYLRERVTLNNLAVKHLVITNIHEWFIFDAVTFERLFAQDKVLVETFRQFEAGALADTKTDFFYRQIAEPFIAGLTTPIEFTHINLDDYRKPLRNADPGDDTKLIALFKILSPEHLLKQPVANDGNSLNRHFYSELLHIIGLTEVKDKGKKLIRRAKAGERHSGTLLESAIIQLDSLDKVRKLKNASQYGDSHEERLFSVALELCITWVNRILFLKLLEAQLLSYHKGDRDYAFLNSQAIGDYDALQTLFFQVLARRHEERNEDVKSPFAKVPYLNSSLFEPTELEQEMLTISNLSNGKSIPILGATVLKTPDGRKRTGSMETLAYLFAFLEAYDFSSEGTAEIQEESKTLINASVLGLIFEKINGYKDGSFFTPSFITMYMCRETLRKAVVRKFNEVKGWNCETLDDLYNKIEDRREANAIINSLTVCDPAVGSGHFLVSALNELIGIKSELRILCDRDGKWLKEYQVDVVNDELIVTVDGELFEYKPRDRESQRVQEAFFHEKQTLIENCLFGVDINPNSVKICRLRLWIELLKNAYYKNETELETLPNIDINIKCGNSLVSRFALDADLRQALKKSRYGIDSYRVAVATYRNASNKDEKREMEELIAAIKADFRTEIHRNDKRRIALLKLETEYNRLTLPDMFQEPEERYGNQDRSKKAEKRIADLEKEIRALKETIREIESNRIYENAFEWRFEFPEVLNEEGDFVGFDVVIGNPPYIRQEELKAWKPYFEASFQTYAGTADLYVYFVEQGFKILRDEGDFCFIIPNKWTKASYGKGLRAYLLDKNIQTFIDFNDLPVFEEATTYPSILVSSNSKPGHTISVVVIKNITEPFDLFQVVTSTQYAVESSNLNSITWNLAEAKNLAAFYELMNNSAPLHSVIGGAIYNGIKTGLNDAFILDADSYYRLLDEHPESIDIFRPFLAGRDIKRGMSPTVSKYLIRIRNGDTRLWFGDKLSESDAFDAMMARYPAVMRHFEPFSEAAKQRGDKGQYWWELRPCDYYDAFDRPKIIYPDMSPQPNFVFVKEPMCLANTAYFFNVADDSLVDYLNSDLIADYMASISPANRGGYHRYFTEYVSRIPVRNTLI